VKDSAKMLKRLKHAVKSLIPQVVLAARTRWIISRQRREFAGLDAQQTFERIYARKHWGEAAPEFDSGSGSADTVTQAYVQMVRDFIARHDVRSVVDLGCGDFRVGRQLATDSVDYTGVDIVRPLVDRNRRRFGGPKVRFEHRNLIEDRDLPRADLALLRQVLQHLSNDEILRVLENCQRYPYLIVTEHLPTDASAIPNLDKPHGPDIRLYDGSGVFLDRPPFSRRTHTLLETRLEPGQTLRSVLIEQEP
jgi:SAM-dependent methyltransferase